jgi:hypothetical protein
MSTNREIRRAKAAKKQSQPNYKSLGGINPNRPYQPDRKRRLIKTDRVNPSDLSKYEVRFFCDDCSHFSETEKRCTLGYVSQHSRKEQFELYILTGTMAFCRFLEID